MGNCARVIVSFVAVLIVCESSFVYASEADYWSMGSFNDLHNAVTEKDRLVASTGLQVEVAMFTTATRNLYRLVVLQEDDSRAQRQTILDSGSHPGP